jgi:hypothetical protein
MTWREQSAILLRLSRLGRALVRAFDLPCHSLSACNCERVGHPQSLNCWGCCSRNGSIRLKIERADGSPRTPRSLEQTLVHEMAHLIHQNHASAFHRLRRHMLRWLTRERSSK